MAQRVLVVDDESRMRKLVKDFLTRAGYQVLEAQDGEEAVDTFYSTKGINLLVLDVMMPKMDGWEVVKEIRKVSKVPNIMLTAKDQEQNDKAYRHKETFVLHEDRAVDAVSLRLAHSELHQKADDHDREAVLEHAVNEDHQDDIAHRQGKKRHQHSTEHEAPF